MSTHDDSQNETVAPHSTAAYRQMVLNVGANFAQSIASETFKQTVFANAAGLAALLAYVANKKPDNAVLLVAAAGVFLFGVGSTLLGMMFTYMNTSRLLAKMLKTVTKGDKYAPDRIDRVTGFLGDFFGWSGICAFCVGACLGGYGLYTELIRRP